MFFEHKDCEYYPCHKMERINCIFCYCPLYHIKDCGGEYVILKNGKKDCSACLFPHDEFNYELICDRLK